MPTTLPLRCRLPVLTIDHIRLYQLQMACVGHSNSLIWLLIISLIFSSSSEGDSKKQLKLAEFDCSWVHFAYSRTSCNSCTLLLHVTFDERARIRHNFWNSNSPRSDIFFCFRPDPLPKMTAWFISWRRCWLELKCYIEDCSTCTLLS